MRRVWLLALATIGIALAGAPAASAARVFPRRQRARAREVRPRPRDRAGPPYGAQRATSLGAGRVLRGAQALARRSHVRKHLVLVDSHKTYDHIDPLSAAPGRNAFLCTVIRFLRRVR